MKIANLLEENNMVYEQHTASYTAIIAESCIGLNALQETITIGVFTDLLPAVKASVITPAVNELRENNLLNPPTLIESVNKQLSVADRWKSVAGKIEDFDLRFTVLESKIFAKLGESTILQKNLNNLYEYATYNHKHDALIIGLLSATASLVNGSAGHTIAEHMLTTYVPISGEYNTSPTYKLEQLVPARPLSEGRIYLLFDNVCVQNQSMLSESVLINVNESANPRGRRYTTQVTPAELRTAWINSGQPQDAGEVAVLIGECGVNGRVVYNTCKNMQIYLNESAVRALNEGPFGNFMAKTASNIGKGIGAVAGGIMAMGKPIKAGYAAGKQAVSDASDGKLDNSQQQAPTAPPAQPQQQAPTAPPAGKGKKQQAPPAPTGNKELDTIVSQVTSLDSKTKNQLLDALKKSIRQSDTTSAKQPPAQPQAQAQLPAPGKAKQQAQLPAPGKAKQQAQLPAVQQQSVPAVQQPATPARQKSNKKFDTSGADDVTYREIAPAQQQQLAAPQQQQQLAAPAQQAPTQGAKQQPPAAPTKQTAPPAAPGKRRSKTPPPIAANESVKYLLKKQLSESYKKY